MFNTAKVEYKDVPKKSGYNVDLKYTNNQTHTKTKNKKAKYNAVLTHPLGKPFEQMLQNILSIGSKTFSKKAKTSQIFQPKYS